MLKHLLATGVILAVLVCAATIALEAVGVLHLGQRGPPQGTDAFLAPIVEHDLPSEMEPDLPQFVHEERKGVDVPDWVGHEEQGDGRAGERPKDEPPAAGPDDHFGQHAGGKAGLRLEVEREPPPRPVQEPKAYAAGLIAAAGLRLDCSEPCAPESLPKSPSGGPQGPPWRIAEPERGKPARSLPRGYRSLGWPVLDWLDAALAFALAWDAGPGPAGRRADL